MNDFIISPVEDPNFHGYFKFGRDRYGIFFKTEDDNYFFIQEMFLKRTLVLFDKDLKKYFVPRRVLS